MTYTLKARSRSLAKLAAICMTAFMLNGTSPPASGQILPGDIAIETRLIASGLVSPIAYVNAGDNRMFIAEQTGQILVVENGQVLPTPFLDISSKLYSPLGLNYDERGLLGLTFHPDFANNGKLYVNYSAPGTQVSGNHHTRIAEYTVSSDPNVADFNSERIILTYDQPQGNHNGGQLAFGPDGYLYIGSGDGGGAGDTGTGHTPVIGNAQDKSNLLGKVLRIDVDNQDSGMEYAIPGDNPFVADPEARDEIYAYGLRNPFSFSFDRGGTHQLFLGDVGQNLVEEVNIIVSGGNYGWRAKEGTLTYDPNLPQEGYIDPIAEYYHPEGSTIIGGFVYRGSLIPELYGKYVFGDFSEDLSFANPVGRARLFYLDPNEPGDPLIQIYELHVGSPHTGLGEVFLKGFGQDADGELYALISTRFGPSGDGGMVVQIVPEPSSLVVLAGAGLPWLITLRRRRK